MKRNDAVGVVLGYWKITSMEVWDRPFIDLVVPGHITFELEEGRLMGRFEFGAVVGWMDCRVSDENEDGAALVEWSWEGRDETDPACGRGWARIAGGKLAGRLFFHCGDDSAVEAERQEPPKKRRARR